MTTVAMSRTRRERSALAIALVSALEPVTQNSSVSTTPLNAISPANYKFSYKGTNELQGRMVHVYQVKPREKRVGLFKGRIYIDVYTGSLVRAEGRPVKSPSLTGVM